MSNADWRVTAAMAAVVSMMSLNATAGKPASAPSAPAKAATTQPAGDATSEPCPTPATTQPAAAGGKGDMSRFASGSPFQGDYKAPVVHEGKRMWAKSLLWEDAPKLVVEKWLSKEPQTKGKYVLIEFWATWCPPCRRSIVLLNALHKKFGKDLVVIGISDETEADVRKLKEPVIEYFSAIDTQARMKKEVGVWGIPHVIVVEPGGCVIWEGFPLLKGFELTEATIEKILAVGRKTGAIKD
jgi:thiol-disulfide isomerase/thioredoxin